MAADSVKTINVAEYDLFAFGDSLTDIGRLSSLTLGLIPPSPPYFEGRASNGPLAVEVLAAQLGANLSQANSFATAGALTGRSNNLVGELPVAPEGLWGLLTQVEQFSNQAEDLGADGNDLYFIWAGANDFLELVDAPVTDPTPVIAEAVSNIATAINELAELGAEKVIVALTPNLGRVPITLEADLSAPITALSNAFNAALTETVTALEGTLEHTDIILVDLFSTSEAIAQDPAAFGFTNTEDPYLIGLNPGDPTADPDRFFFWDAVHPTARGHALFADTFYESVITGISADVTLLGTPTAETLVGFGGNDNLQGQAGDDVLIGNLGDDRLFGEAGGDRLTGAAGNDRLFGGDGNDRVIGGDGNDTAVGGSGDDRILGGEGDDRVVGNAGNERLVGGAGTDRLIGGSGDDTLIGGADADQLLGAGGNDLMRGNLGDDILNGGAGDDRQFGGAGADRLNGQGRDDVLRGGTGDDVLRGGGGNDRLLGEAGNDVLFGGPGRDRFVVRSGQGGDRLVDFEDGQDLIVLPGLSFEQLSLEQQGRNVAIASGGELLLLALNTTVAQLSAADFV